MSTKFKIRLFKGITQCVGCITILNYSIKYIRYILIHYWSIVEMSYLTLAEIVAFAYMSTYIGSCIYRQVKHRKNL